MIVAVDRDNDKEVQIEEVIDPKHKDIAGLGFIKGIFIC